jgi:hypothetical protein
VGNNRKGPPPGDRIECIHRSIKSLEQRMMSIHCVIA